MSLSRAFTTKRQAKRDTESVPAMPKRSLTTKFPAGTIRHKISAPIELISTTNMLSYNAPDIYPRSTSSSISSHSADDSDRSPASPSSPLTSPDTSSIESSSPTSMKPNHLSCYFGAPTSDNEAVPTIPKRAPSHTKSKASVENFLARKHTTASTTSRISRKTSTSTARSSINMFATHIETVEERANHPSPFSHELAQVSEIAEEYGISKEKLAVVDEEEQELVSRGLFKFRAEDYISEIQGLFSLAFGDSKPSMATMWI